jgi:type IV secretion system protein VirB1
MKTSLSQQFSYKNHTKNGVLKAVTPSRQRNVNKVHTRIIQLPKSGFLMLALLVFSPYLPGQSNSRLPMATFNQLAARCAPSAAVDTLQAVALTESAMHPYALSLNYPATVAANNGLHNQEVFLTRQPTTLAEAIRWTSWFHRHGYTVSIGLMQINSENATRYGVTVRELFDPCTNVAVGARLLGEIYSSTSHGGRADVGALVSTFSAYNSGSFTAGIKNGYAATVMNNAHRGTGN